MTELSIVIVTYRCRVEALNCLESLSGGLGNLRAQVIVLDNASGDNVTVAINEAFPEVETIALTENIGYAAANNLGIARAEGEFILLLNPDTLIPAGGLKKCVEFLKAQPESVGALGCRLVTPEGKTQWECARRLVTPAIECRRALWPFSPAEALPQGALERTAVVECLLGAFMLFRSGVLKQLGGFDERFFLMYEDVDLCRRVKDAGYSLLYWPEVVVTHLGGASWSKEKALTYSKTYSSAVLYYQKHFPGSVNTVKAFMRLGLVLRLVALRFLPQSPWRDEHIAMCRAAREAMRS